MGRIHLHLLAVAIAAFISHAPTVRAAESFDAEMVKAALHTNSTIDGGFIDSVFAKVAAGTLPMDLVQSTFLWARRKPENRRFFYFKQGLIMRAKERGIDL